MPKISIVVPIYNVEKYLKQCLDSILNQTFKDIEIICVNDGSTDGSVQILDEYKAKDKRIIVIDKENSGYGASMNMGLDAASGEYIGIVESDDFIKPNMYEELYKLIQKHDCDFVKSEFSAYWEKPKKIEKQARFAKFNCNTPITLKDDIRLLKLAPSVWSSLYKREFLNKNNIRFLETPGASYQDTSFHYKIMLLAERIVLTDRDYLFYRQDNMNCSCKSKDKVYAICKEYAEVLRFINENSKLEEFKQFIYIQQFNAYNWNLFRIADSFRAEFFDYYYNEFKNYYDNGELKENFYKFLKKKKYKFNMFINSPNKYYKHILKQIQKEKFNNFRKKLISIKINRQRASVVLFNRQVLRINGKG